MEPAIYPRGLGENVTVPMGAFERPEEAEGFKVLHDPRRAEVDVVFVHGLGGHPYKTWASTRKNSFPTADIVTAASRPAPVKKKRKLRNFFRRFRLGRSGDSRDWQSGQTASAIPLRNGKTSKYSVAYWPRDFLAEEDSCECARILVYGYDSKITKGFEIANQNGLFAHARDFLWALQREKPAGRPVIFVAHSLGGLLVKEVLRRSEESDKGKFKDIVLSTKGVIFLGTPHRGSPGMASLGETVRGIASALLRVGSNGSLLRALGTDSSELDPGRESFLTLWRKYNFYVKTFQEACGVTGINVGRLNAKVVPDFSSTLDDPREHAESISANHMNMCRFNTRHDAGYRKLAAEIKTAILLSRTTPEIGQDGHEFLQSLAFDEMNSRRGNIQSALDDTCSWLYSTPQYAYWINRKNVSVHHGLLWIKGKPGSGKSTLMKDALRQAELKFSGSQTTTAGFFFNARGTQELEKIPLGLYRSLLHQVLRQDVLALAHLTPVFEHKARFESTVVWHEEELQDLLRSVFATSESRPATIFIDAMDECNDGEVRNLVRFCKALAKKAYEVGASLNVCLSSRHYPHISIDGCPEVVVEDNNQADILRYIVSEAEDNRPIKDLKDEIFEKSSGVFLWVVLVIAILRKYGRGKSLKWLQQKVRETPPELDTLFRTLLSRQDREEAERMVCLMQLVLFAKESLTLSQIHQALAFGRTRYASFAAWRDSVECLETPTKMREMVVDLSRGLLEEAPGSVEKEEEPTYQFIHETVREFFLSGDGFKLLQFESSSIAGSGNSMMATCCVNYLATYECSQTYQIDSALALLDYISAHIFDHIEAAVQSGTPQNEVIFRLSDNSCELLCRLSRLRRSTRFIPGSTILMAAVGFDAIETATHILDMGFNVNESSTAPLRYALLAALSGPLLKFIMFRHKQPQLEMVRLMLRHGANVLLQNRFGQTALHIAATKNTEVLLAVLEKHPQVNVQDSDGETPLHRAALSIQYKAVANILLKHGARIDIKDQWGRTPVDVATLPQHLASGVKEMVEGHVAVGI